MRRIVREIGALTAVLGGLDMLAFTAGVGEHSAALRARICGALAWLGIEIDDAANLAQRAGDLARAQPRPGGRGTDQRGMDRCPARIALHRRGGEGARLDSIPTDPAHLDHASGLPTSRSRFAAMSLHPNPVPEPACVRAQAASDATPDALVGRLENLVTGRRFEFGSADELLDVIIHAIDESSSDASGD